MAEENVNLNDIRDYFDDKLQQFGSTPRGVDYNSPHSQEHRFAQLIRILQSNDSYTLLDFGSGYGSLYGYLLRCRHRLTYDGYDSLVAPGEYFPAPRSVGFWVENNGCTPIPEKESLYGGQILKDSYSGCKQGVEVSFYTLPTGDHGWPMLTNPANKSMVTGSDLMWDFFAAHPRLQPAP